MTTKPMIVLFTDFGSDGPYLGQMQAVLHQNSPESAVINLLSNAPVHDPKASAYLLAAYKGAFPVGTVFLCVVDPGVGSAGRRAVVVEVDGQWFVGPDNGLFNIVAMRGRDVAWWDITWRPEKLSASFHGRDLFAPVAARLANGKIPPGDLCDAESRIDNSWPEELSNIIYIDHFGNALTGIRAAALDQAAQLLVKGHHLSFARTFSDVPPTQAFWYENANGLVEIAVNQGRADHRLGLCAGDEIVMP